MELRMIWELALYWSLHILSVSKLHVLLPKHLGIAKSNQYCLQVLHKKKKNLNYLKQISNFFHWSCFNANLKNGMKCVWAWLALNE